MNPENTWKFPASWFFYPSGFLAAEPWRKWSFRKLSGSKQIHLVVCEPLFNRRSVCLALQCWPETPFASFAQHFTDLLHYQHSHGWFIPLHSHKQRIHSWRVSFESCVQCHIHINLNAVVKQFTSIYPVCCWPFDVQPMITRQSPWRIIKWALSLRVMWYVYHTPSCCSK